MVSNMQMNHQYTIFLSIAAYNERYLKQTVDSAIATAAYPQRISFGILEQRIDSRFCDFKDYKNVKHITATYRAPLGVGAARNYTLALHDIEDFIFQIDAHMIFEKDWDKNLVDRYLEIYQHINIKKIVITLYTAWWMQQPDGTKYFSDVPVNSISTLNYNPEPFFEQVSLNDIEVLIKTGESFGTFYAILDNGHYKALVRDWRGIRHRDFDNFDDAKHWMALGFNDAKHYPKYGSASTPALPGQTYQEQYLFAAGVAFSIPEFFKDILLDPAIQFGGEEPTMSLRGWTRGYRFFSIIDHLLWHMNKKNLNDPEDRLSNPGDPLLLDHYHAKMDRSLLRVESILKGEILGYWGAPDLNSLKAYEQVVSFDFQQFYKDIKQVAKQIG